MLGGLPKQSPKRGLWIWGLPRPPVNSDFLGKCPPLLTHASACPALPCGALAFPLHLPRSQQVVDFVRQRLAAGAAPQDAASELLNACLAEDPRAARGIGCDNMTAAVRCVCMRGRVDGPLSSAARPCTSLYSLYCGWVGCMRGWRVGQERVAFADCAAAHPLPLPPCRLLCLSRALGRFSAAAALVGPRLRSQRRQGRPTAAAAAAAAAAVQTQPCVGQLRHQSQQALRRLPSRREPEPAGADLLAAGSAFCSLHCRAANLTVCWFLCSSPAPTGLLYPAFAAAPLPSAPHPTPGILRESLHPYLPTALFGQPYSASKQVQHLSFPALLYWRVLSSLARCAVPGLAPQGSQPPTLACAFPNALCTSLLLTAAPFFQLPHLPRMSSLTPTFPPTTLCTSWCNTHSLNLVQSSRRCPHATMQALCPFLLTLNAPRIDWPPLHPFPYHRGGARGGPCAVWSSSAGAACFVNL